MVILNIVTLKSGEPSYQLQYYIIYSIIWDKNDNKRSKIENV